MSGTLDKKIDRLKSLEGREKEILDILMVDPVFNVEDIAKKMHISIQYFNSFKTSMFKKLEVPTSVPHLKKRKWVSDEYSEAYKVYKEKPLAEEMQPKISEVDVSEPKEEVSEPKPEIEEPKVDPEPVPEVKKSPKRSRTKSREDRPIDESFFDSAVWEAINRRSKPNEVKLREAMLREDRLREDRIRRSKSKRTEPKRTESRETATRRTTSRGAKPKTTPPIEQKPEPKPEPIRVVVREPPTINVSPPPPKVQKFKFTFKTFMIIEIIFVLSVLLYYMMRGWFM